MVLRRPETDAAAAADRIIITYNLNVCFLDLLQGLVLDGRVQVLLERVVLALGHVHQQVERRLVVGTRQERRGADLRRAVHIGQSVKLMMGHRRKRIGRVTKVPRAQETGREPDEQRGQNAHHHQQTDNVAQRDHCRQLGDLFLDACFRNTKGANVLKRNINEKTQLIPAAYKRI